MERGMWKLDILVVFVYLVKKFSKREIVREWGGSGIFRGRRRRRRRRRSRDASDNRTRTK